MRTQVKDTRQSHGPGRFGQLQKPENRAKNRACSPISEPVLARWGLGSQNPNPVMGYVKTFFAAFFDRRKRLYGGMSSITFPTFRTGLM